jgi:small conductance mechanosensitive channel
VVRAGLLGRGSVQDLATEGRPEPAEEETRILRDVDAPELSELTDPATLRELISDAVSELAGDVLVRLPLILLAVVVLILLLITVRFVLLGVKRGMKRADVDFPVRRLVANLLRLVLIVLSLAVALSIAGVEVGAVLATLGLIGLGLALAMQNILENFIAGVLILMRKPYDRHEIIVTNGIEGYVEDIDLRVTTIREYNGTLTLVPNADVLANPLTNLTRRGVRRGEVMIGIDYRDDHEVAREVLLAAVDGVDLVLEDPPPVVLLRQLGDSSVDFAVRFWLDVEVSFLPVVEDAVLRACKTAVDEAGLTIPWPIRTLAADKGPLEVRSLGRGEEAPATGANDPGPG